MQDNTLRALVGHLTAVEFDTDSSADARADASTARKAVAPRGINPSRSHAVRASEGAQARSTLDALGIPLAGLPTLGGQSVEARLRSDLAASDACASALSAQRERQSDRKAGAVGLAARRELMALLDGLRAALAAESQVNAALSPDLDRRLFVVVDEARLTRRAATSIPAAPAAPSAPLPVPAPLSHAG